MSWFKTAYTVCNLDPRSYFVTVDLPTFYEWKFSNNIPEGTILTKEMPRSDTLAGNLVIASLIPPPEAIARTENKFRVTMDFQPGPMRHIVGQIKTPEEVVRSFDRVAEQIMALCDRLKQSCEVKKYFIAGSKEPHLYRVKSIFSDRVVLDNMGTLENLNKMIAALQVIMQKESTVRTGRAIEAADSRRFDHVVTRLKNGTLPMSNADIDFVISKAELEPVNSRTLSWRQCLLETNPEAVELEEKLAKFNSLTWVQKVAPTVNFSSKSTTTGSSPGANSSPRTSRGVSFAKIL